MIQPTGAAPGDGRGDEEVGDDAETPLARLMGQGNRVQLLRSLDLEVGAALENFPPHNQKNS
jgi:hypothetical protein